MNADPELEIAFARDGAPGRGGMAPIAATFARSESTRQRGFRRERRPPAPRAPTEGSASGYRDVGDGMKVLRATRIGPAGIPACTTNPIRRQLAAQRDNYSTDNPVTFTRGGLTIGSLQFHRSRSFRSGSEIRACRRRGALGDSSSRRSPESHEGWRISLRSRARVSASPVCFLSRTLTTKSNPIAYHKGRTELRRL